MHLVLVLVQILVRYRGALPDLFREGHSVVAEGYLKPMAEAHSESPSSSASPAKAAAAPAPPPQAGARGAGAQRTGEAHSAEGLERGVEDVAQRARRMGVMFTAVEVLAKHDEVRLSHTRRPLLKRRRPTCSVSNH